ncbi:MAG: radical SAM peptide maturase [Bacteroidetes bacterium]|nr:MAG: radical SAM peptide maturase [Bacteroidota bacterium]
MKAAIPFTTSSGHTYFYSSHNKQFLLSHPLINYFISLSADGKQWRRVISKALKTPVIDLPGLGSFENSEFLYYLNKYKFLRKHGYFKPGAVKNRDGTMPPERIDQNLAQTRQIIFETTEDCNLDCVYCTYSKFYFNKDRERNNIKTGDALQLLELVLGNRRNNPDQELAVSFYGGEPLKNFKFIEEIVNYVNEHKNRNQKIKYSLTTNGLLLRKYIRFLVENDFELAISLDGDEFANSFRVLKSNKKPSFVLVSRNIDMVREKYPSYFDRRVIFLTVRHSRNTLKTIYEHFSPKYGKTPILSSITTIGVIDEFQEEFNETFLKSRFPASENTCYVHELFTRHPIVSETSEMLERYGNFVFRNPKQLLNPMKKHTDTRKYLPTATCSPFDLRIYMSADGGIYPCEHISRIFELGSVRDSKTDIDGNKISGTYNTYFQKIKKLCNQCYLSDNCKECIFNTGVEKGVPVCEYFMNREKFTSHMTKLFNNLENDQLLFARIRDEAFLAR